MVKRVRIIKGGGERKETNPLKIVLLLIILAVLVYLLILTNKKTELTGNVITTLTIPSDCSNESLKALWDSIFKESSDSIIIYPNISQAGECTFQAYKIKNGQEVYSLFGGILAPNSKFISIQANYINFSDNYLNPLAINLTEITDLSKISLANITLRNINNMDYAQSAFIYSFKPLPETWQESSMNNQPSYTFINYSNISGVFISNLGIVYRNQSINGYNYVRIITNPTPTNCIPAWTEIEGACSSTEELIISYNNSNNCLNFTTPPSNITRGCDYDNNGLIANTNSITGENIILDVYEGSSIINLSRMFNTTKEISFREGNKTIISFSYDFSQPLNLKNITIVKQNSASPYGFLIINGLNIQKITTINKMNNLSNSVCILDSLVNNISEITNQCNASNEYLVSCPGTSSTFTCNISGSDFIVSGLMHSAIREFTNNNTTPTLGCTPNWQCLAWSTCVNNQKTTTCSDLNNCNNLTGKPLEIEACTSCKPQWNCTDWQPKKCNNGTNQTRNCVDTNNCGVDTDKPAEIQSCESKGISLSIILIIAGIILLLVIFVVMPILYFNNKSSEEKKTQIGELPRQEPLPPPMKKEDEEESTLDKYRRLNEEAKNRTVNKALNLYPAPNNNPNEQDNTKFPN